MRGGDERAGGQDAAGASAPGSGRLLGFYLYLVAALALPSQLLFWDDIGFLQNARALELDYGHALYVPALRLFQWLASPVSSSEEYAAKVFSMLGGALAFALFWRRLERQGTSRPTALVAALLVTASPLFWRQLSVIEPTTWTVAGLLLSADLAEAWGRSRRARTLAALLFVFVATLGMHVVSLCALPWLVWLTRRPGALPPRRALWLPAGALAVLLAVGLASAERTEGFLAYWRGFLPRPEGARGAATLLGEHLRLFGEVLVRGTPALAAGCALVLLAASSRAAPGQGEARRAWRARAGESALLVAPYLAAFCVLGRPVVGLLVPVALGLAMLCAAGARLFECGRPALGRGLHACLATALALQAFAAAGFALHHATTPDMERERAQRLAAALPEDAVLLAGPLAHHVRWHTDAPVVPLPNRMPAELAQGRGPLAALDRLARAELERYAAVYVSGEALDWLVSALGADPGALPRPDEHTIRLGEGLELFLLARRGERASATRPPDAR